MHTIKINRKNNNLELVSKLMNSVAAKYNCTVKYNRNDGGLCFTGDDAFKPLIAEDTMRLFAKNQ
ncbi:hypothetical protein DENIS_1300 [Desulfonema ishimotonii]|uniref:Uncharacterized protein n=1 Tax=Desulfonema ishimotonii TaxID=45657 RepID=A0A401FTQ6_9BACT|nr:hypothetical protein [Desulfonema ishimotonii]GBC60349.1 hypothetical protein DENIS_1300 [Desulfonema ishimotonii]